MKHKSTASKAVPSALIYPPVSDPTEEVDMIPWKTPDISDCMWLGNPTMRSRHKASRIIYDFRCDIKMLLDIMKTTPTAQRYMSLARFRGQWVGYLAKIAIQNVTGGDLSILDPLFTLCGGFEYDREIKQSKWLVPLTGSLFNDMRANFVANYVHKKDAATAITVATLCLEIIATQAENNIAGMFASWASLPLIPHLLEPHETGEIIFYCEQFYSLKTANTQSTVVPDKYTDYYQDALLNEEGYRWYSSLCDTFSCNLPEGISRAAIPALGIIDTRMMPPDKAFRGFSLPAIFPPETEFPENELIVADTPNDMPSLTQGCMVLLSSVLPLIARERLEYREAQIASTKNRKADNVVEQLEKSIAKLKQENALLQSQVAAAAAQTAQENEKHQRKIAKSQLETARIERLEHEKLALTDAKRMAENRAEEATAYRAELEKEIDSLQTALWNSQHSDDAACTTDDETDVSVFDTVTIVCVGGHPSWATEMKNIHPNLRIYDSATVVPDNALANADAIWVQTNSISHADFYRCSDATRCNHIPLRYFRGAGHGTCRQQIIKETNALFPRQGKDVPSHG